MNYLFDANAQQVSLTYRIFGWPDREDFEVNANSSASKIKVTDSWHQQLQIENISVFNHVRLGVGQERFCNNPFHQLTEKNIVCFVDLSNEENFKKSLSIIESFLPLIKKGRREGRVPDENHQKVIIAGYNFAGGAGISMVQVEERVNALGVSIPVIYEPKVISHRWGAYEFLETHAKQSLKADLPQIKEQVEQKKGITELIQTLSTICMSEDLWQSKVRNQPKFADKMPEGIRQIKNILMNTKNLSTEALLENIVALAKHKHSEHFFWAHSLCRGRDKQTNQLYKLLSSLDVSKLSESSKYTKEYISQLNEMFGALPSNDSNERLLPRNNN
ncbi:MAG: hypothetical protein J0I93_14000 [Legionella sp.]|nr:hypothetical protein [Legionella sp.]